ncbi:hypothetical protein Q5Y75_24630 [Ruegeria sp. 2205SS24-7]|uniref:hypothetical protein n=1 Tax=Ruegeria discodermiae TaxID=3064389 RepID=UPI002742655B|nr:hypothetical protein [Ruegeria sp. 2205SS24-7]MDP5220378.1 hypothetical protein [Ruegeria sp. 2205SS24-7]
MKLDEILKRTNRHVAILGAFNLERNQPKVMRGRASEVLEKLSFSLMSNRVQRLRNGNIPFYSYAVTAPAELAGKGLGNEAIKTYQVLPDGDGVLSKYLKDPHRKPSDIGAELLKSLLDAGDALRPYEDPAFGIQLTEGLYYALDSSGVLASRGVSPDIVDAMMLRELLYHPGFNQAFQDFLRASDGQILAAALDTALQEAVYQALGEQPDPLVKKARKRLAEAFAAETAAYRSWLDSTGGASSDHSHFAVLDSETGHGAEFQAVRTEHPIQEHKSAGLREAYGYFRSAHDQVTDLAQCEPLMAFITQWYLESFSEQVAGKAMADAIFEAIYQGNKEAQPSRIPLRVKRAAAAAHAAAMKTLLEEPSKKPQDVMAREMAEEALEAYLKVRRPISAFERDDLIDLMREELMTLSLKLFPGREKIDATNAKLVDAFYEAERGVEKCFQVAKEKDAEEKLREVMEPVFKTLGEEVTRAIHDLGEAEVAKDQGTKTAEIFEATLKKVGAEPKAIAEALNVALGAAEGEAKALVINAFREAEGGAIEEAGEAVRAAYERLLSTSAGMKVAGSLGPVSDPELSANEVREAKVRVEIARLLSAGSDAVQGLPADETEAGELEVMPAGRTTEEESSVEATATASGTDSDGSANEDELEADAADPPTTSVMPADESSTDKTAHRELSTRAPRPISMALTAEERKGLLEEAAETELEKSPRGRAAAVRRLAEQLVDARDRVMAEKGRLAREPRLNTAGDPVGKALAAGLRFLRLGENFLTAPMGNSPLGKPDTSFSAMIALHLMKQTGREHGPGQRDLLTGWKQQAGDEPATAAIRKVPLWQICPAIFDADGLDEDQFVEKFRKEAGRALTGFIREVQRQIAELQRLSGFYRDVEEVKDLLNLLAYSGDCEVTVVNTIATEYDEICRNEAYPSGGPLFNGRRDLLDDVPPGMVFVSGQAFAPEAPRDVDVLIGALGLGSDDSGTEPLRATESGSYMQTNAHPGTLGIPVVFGRGIESQSLPVVGFDVPGLSELLVLLTGASVGGLPRFREKWGEHTRIAGLPEIGPDNTVVRALAMMLRSPEVHSPIISAHVLTGLTLQSQFGPLDKQTRSLRSTSDFQPAETAPLVVQAVDAALAALDPLAEQLGETDLGELVYMYRDGAWEQIKIRNDGVGEPGKWIAFAPPPGHGEDAPPNPLFDRLFPKTSKN